MARPAPTALAMARYASSRTDSLSLSRTARDRPVVGLEVTGWAAARLSACCSRRSILKSSARMDSSLSHGAACDVRPKARRIADFNLAFPAPRVRGARRSSPVSLAIRKGSAGMLRSDLGPRGLDREPARVNSTQRQRHYDTP